MSALTRTMCLGSAAEEKVARSVVDAAVQLKSGRDQSPKGRAGKREASF